MIGRSLIGVALVSLAPAAALADTYHCVSRVLFGFDGAVLDDWRAGEQFGRTRFSFDTASGKYLETREGSAAAITDTAKLDIVMQPPYGSGELVAMESRGGIVLKIDDSAHGVNYVRLGGGGLAEIGKCEKAATP